MKKTILLSSVLFVFAIWAGSAFAVPYTGADIELLGNQYSDSSGRWMDGDVEGSIFTAWANQWVTYEAALTEGIWNIGLNVINYGDLGDGWYLAFSVEAQTSGGVYHLEIPASSTEVTNGYFTETLYLADDDYAVKYTWLNDQYAPSLGLDANIQINSAFFDNLATPGGVAPVPEPATMVLLGIGLAVLAFVSRHKAKK